MSPPDASLPSPDNSQPSTGDLLLRVDGLQKSFGDHQVLASISFTLRAGQVLALIGPSGSGKTTVLRCLNGLEQPDAGTVAFADGPQVAFGAGTRRKEWESLRTRSAMVFQQHNLFPHLTVLQNIIEGPVRVQRRPRAEVIGEAEQLLSRVGLAEKRDARPHELSGGQQQRVGIVRALALRPSLLLFDEPTSALDPELVGDVLRVIKELADEGWSMVLVTHELVFAREVADEVLFIDDGLVVEHGPADQVLRNPAQPRTRQFIQRLLHPF